MFKLNDDHRMVKVMDDKRLATRNPHEEVQDAPEFRDRTGDRRKVPSKGFTHISMVGWICRRERCRRKNDKMDFLQTAFWAKRRQG
jgi:hypothetical protein